MIVGLVLVSAPAPPSVGAEAEQPEQAQGVQLGDEQVTHWKIGMIVHAVGGPCRGLFGTVPIPDEWPEQHVTVIEEDISPTVRVSHRQLEGVKQMLVRIPVLPAGSTAKALVTIEVRRQPIMPPQDPSVGVCSHVQ
jgi:hypothetical protein